MFILYTVAPLLYRMASSAYYNLSLLSSDFYGLLFGLFLYGEFLRPSACIIVAELAMISTTARTGSTLSPSPS